MLCFYSELVKRLTEMGIASPFSRDHPFFRLSLRGLGKKWGPTVRSTLWMVGIASPPKGVETSVFIVGGAPP